ncbi:DNA repair endonuclease UVH1 [Linum grandiflorum]
MVRFHEQIIADLLDEPSGGVVILSSGLSLSKLVSSLLLLHDPSQGSLLILSPSSHSVKSQITYHLQSLSSSSSNDDGVVGENRLQIAEITAELPTNNRLSLYTSGRICFITARILIVDLLTNRIPVSNLAGLILLNVHSLSETSTEAFIVRIVKSLSRSVYVRAFSDKPHSMVAGFAKTERIMKALYIRKLHLWPRFQVYVSEELEKTPPEVVDVRVPMSKYMVGIQKAIIEVMDACLKEMRKTNKVDVEDLTVENGLFKSFDEIVKRQLDPIWHTLGKKTKQLVSDLKTLRKLLDYLVRYDAVSYLKYLDTLRVSESFRSVWIFAESSHKIFDYAKRRVYRFTRSNEANSKEQSKALPAKRRKLSKDGTDKEGDDASSTSISDGIALEEVLEEAPKWKVLREILEEIEDERTTKQDENFAESDELDSGIVLVACKDERSCMQLEDCMTKGPRKVMQEEWKSYLLSKVDLRGSVKTPQKKKAKEPKGVGILDGVVPVTISQKTEASSSINKQEHDALIAAALQIRKNAVDEKKQPHIEGNKKRKGTRGKQKKTDQAEISEVDENSSVRGVSMPGGALRRHHSEEDPNQAKSETAKRIPPLYFYALERDEPILDMLKPSVIVVYHPDTTFVREIEVYKAENPSKVVKVYFLFYEASTEVQKFDASIRRENGAFETLIRQKSMMMIPVDQYGHSMGLNSYEELDGLSSSQNSITRKAGGRKDPEKEMQIIVDMREFMSSLPNVLHQKGMGITPVTLEVGDYILSPLICVERKSIQDLFGSFASGRLYNQAEMMVRYYKIPVLLIEFSQDKSFSFQSASDIGDDVTPYSVISKLSLLALHFPRLRIIWSRSLHATAEIFAALKANQDEPELDKAVRVGVPSEEGIVENDTRAENYNTSAVEFLRRLPGVTDSNYRSIMDGCKSLSELALMPVERLAEIMGGQKSARTLREFLDAKYPTLL